MKWISRELIAAAAMAVLALGSAGCDLQSTIWSMSSGAGGLSSDKLASSMFKFHLAAPPETLAADQRLLEAVESVVGPFGDLDDIVQLVPASEVEVVLQGDGDTTEADPSSSDQEQGLSGM